MAIAIRRRIGAFVLSIALALGTIGAMGHNTQEFIEEAPRVPVQCDPPPKNVLGCLNIYGE